MQTTHGNIIAYYHVLFSISGHHLLDFSREDVCSKPRKYLFR